MANTKAIRYYDLVIKTIMVKKNSIFSPLNGIWKICEFKHLTEC